VSENSLYDIEKENLETHVTVCAERYKRLEEKFSNLENRLDILSNELAEMRNKTQANMNELKELIQKSSDNRFRAVVAASGTIVAALISALAYVITRLG
jgi:predicted  nucleic acid-binding Zn-ribbon protein